MSYSRPRVLVRGIVALGFALLFATFTVSSVFMDEGHAVIAPAVAAGVAAVALAGLALSAFALYDRAAANARRPMRVAHTGVFAIPVSGLLTGAVVWAASGDVTVMGVAVWGTAIIWLVHLILVRGQARDVRSATQ